MWFATKTDTTLAFQYSQAVKKGMLGIYSQKIDPTLPYYQPSFELLPQPAIATSNSSSNSTSAQASKVTATFEKKSAYSLINKIVINWIIVLISGLIFLIALTYFGPKISYSLSGLLRYPSSKIFNQLANLLGVVPAGELDSSGESSKLRQLQEEYSQYLTDVALQEQPDEDPGQAEVRYLPEQDLSLPSGDLLIIDKIGVNTQLQRTESETEALDTGAWWVPDFGVPGDLQMPMIVSAHRYGWEWWWKSDYWQLHSFYKLPQLQPGDRVEIISEQRRFIYEIYAIEEGEQISDYDADLILYTCKHLNSPIRYFGYARIIRDN